MKDEEGSDIEDKPRWVSETLPFYGLFADKAKSTQRYHAFDPNEDWEGDFSKALGMPCNVTIVNNTVGDKTYDNVATISAMRQRDADRCAELKNPAVAFDLDAPDMNVFNKFPKWIQDKIKGNLNYAGSPLEQKLGKDAGKKEEPKKEVQQQDDDEDNAPY